ncbi:WbqC family protein [Gimesia chilikensis]|uniref:WbqC family protein n=1 Tax=Gimesia chilikensis TaxID=2605989 RepID=UPI0011EF1148|nr:WbqC family protein [Gimesia chilikensis]KAA0140532.1 WbqC family protein [Gimesia chilikensis]
MNCVILQPAFIPWRGYFHLIQKADVFIFYDDVQFDKHGWRNRNRIKGSNGSFWLTIPVLTKGTTSQGIKIKDVIIDNQQRWKRKHLASIEQAYSKAPHYKSFRDAIQEIYSMDTESISSFTINAVIMISELLGISDVRFVKSSELCVTGDKTGRLVEIVKETGADHYISGPSAREYIQQDQFHESGITLEYMEYNYPEYEQLHPPYDPQLSILDLLFMKGQDAHRYIWG